MTQFFPEIAVERVFVIDQDRAPTSADVLRSRLGPVNVLSYQPSDAHFRVTGHDHAHVLNLAIRDLDHDYVLLFDSDAHPISAVARRLLGELVSGYDAVLAAFEGHGVRTHPCFMVLGPQVDRNQLWFDEGQLQPEATDTGRQIARQVEAMGCAAYLTRPTRAFAGNWGTMYLDGSVYHHGSGSFASNPDPRLQVQVERWHPEHDYFRRKVFRGDYTHGAYDRLALGFRRVLGRPGDR